MSRLPRGADPDGFDATTSGDKDREAALQASLRGMSALELEPDDYDYNEDEIETVGLMRAEAAGFGNGMSRRPATANGSKSTGSINGGGALSAISASVHRLYDALPERNKKISLRNLILIGGLAGLTFLFVDNADVALEMINQTHDIDESAGYQFSPHESSFGGINNMGHPAGAKAAEAGAFAKEEIFVPVSNVGHAFQSISAENVLNYQGHYVHDEHRSPYASHLYDRPKAELDQEQSRFLAKMAKIREEWGAWDFTDKYWSGKGPRPAVDFTKTPYRDVPSSSFPKGSWQTDREYTDNFIKEAKALVDRVKEGVYAEYGMPTKKADGITMSDEERVARDELWGVDHVDGAAAKGIAQLDEHSWNGLIRKLLHAMITHDEFYVVLGGHSSAAGHGNNFRQTKAMQFHYLMEPVMDKLGVRLITRNSAQGGVGTTHSAFAGASIYGEKDIFLWDSSMTERDPGATDIFQKQGILGGERVPVIFDCPRHDIVAETNGTVWLGTTDMSGAKLDHMETTDEKQAESVPWALRWSKCEKNRGDLCQAHKYNSVCWDDRKDVTPPTAQTTKVGGQAGWHPGDITHKRMGRVWSLMVLHALDAALDLWKEKNSEEGGFPLDDKYWHIGEEYLKIQNTLRTHINSKPVEIKEGEEDTRSACEKKFDRWPRVCRIAMRAYGEWQPRANPDFTELRSILKAAPNGYKPYAAESNVYDGIDLALLDHPDRGTFPRIPDDAVDVHMIATATTKPEPDLDHSLPDDGERRRLADLSRQAMKTRLDRAKAAFKTKWNILQERRRARRSRSLRLSNSSRATSSLRRRLDGDEEIIPGQGWTLASNFHTGFCDGSYMSECDRDPANNCLEIGHNDGRGCYQGDALSGWIVFTVPNVKEGLILIRLEWWHPNNGSERTKGWTEVNNGKTMDTSPFFTAAPTSAPTATSGGESTNPNSTDTLRLVAGRHLPAKNIGPIPDDWQFDIAIDGKVSTSSRGTGTDTGTTHGLASDDVQESRRELGKVDPLPDDFKFDIALNGKIVNTMNTEEFNKYNPELVKNFALWTVMDDPEWAKKDWGDSEGEDVEVGLRLRSTKVPHTTIGFSHVYYA